MGQTPSSAGRVIAPNKKARHNFFVEEEYEAGIQLRGTEVKALREGRVNFMDSYAAVRNGELFLEGLHIGAYSHANRQNHPPTRPRKLLMHKREVARLIGKIQERGRTLVPLDVHFNERNIVKVKLGLCRGKKLHDKRAVEREKTMKREMDQALRQRRK